jgi:similar to stage IV sporulation protein
MFSKIFRYCRGRVYIKAQGEKLSAFINEAIRDGIVFYHAKRTPDSFIAEISIDDFSRLRRAAKTADIKLNIRAKYGFPFVAYRWRKRKGLIAGLFIVFAALTILSQFVLSVSVEGNSRVPADTIISEAEKLGVKKWVLKRQLNLEELSVQLQENIPDLVWVTMEERGTNIRIRLVEKTLPPKVVYQGDLIAAKSGLVEEVIVIQGQPVVKEGQMVNAGQTLIKAEGGMVEYRYDAGGKDAFQKDLVNAPAAKGFVRGRVWYSADIEVPLEEDIVEKTGNYATGWGIKIGNRAIMITNQHTPYADSTEVTYSYVLPAWRNWSFPVEIIKKYYEEQQTVHVKRTVAEARELAESRARAELQKEIPDHAKILQNRVRILSSVIGVEHVRVEIETYEELAVYRQ